MLTKNDVIEKAIELVQAHGRLDKVENLEGKVEIADIENFKILIATPFSGAEVLPDKKGYILDIWKDSKKVFSETTLGENPKRIEQPWVDAFLALN